MRPRVTGIRFRNALVFTAVALVSFLTLLLTDGPAESRESKGLRIVAIRREILDKIPVINFTVKNNTPKSQILNKLKVVVLEYDPYSSIPKTRTLERLVIWDVVLPFGTGEFTINAKGPVLIESDDAATIGVSFSCSHNGKRISPFETGRYIVSLSLISESGLHIDSEPETF